MVVFAAGGNNSGKSRVACQELIWWCRENHPYKTTPQAPKIWVVAAMYQNMWSGVYEHWRTYMPRWDIIDEGPMIEGWQIPKWTRCRTGAEIWWMSAKGGGGGDGRQKFQSANLDLVLVDEEIEKEAKEELEQRLVTKGGKFYISATMVESVAWLTEIEERGESGDPQVDLIRFNSRAAARAGHIDTSTLKVIESGMTEEEREVRVFGRSRKTQGLVYPEFDPQKHIRPPREITGKCTRYCAIDPGWDTCAVLWGAVYEDGCLELYRELYLHNLNYRQIANRILGAEGWQYDKTRKIMVPTPRSEFIERRVIDPSAFGKHTDGSLRIGHKLPKFGVRLLVQAINDIDMGVDGVRDMLLDINANGAPRFIVQSHLVHWLKERANYKFPRRSPKGESAAPRAKPIKRNDHLMDATRYLVNFPGGLKFKEVPSKDAENARMFYEHREAIGVTGSLKMSLERELNNLHKEADELELSGSPHLDGFDF